MTTRMRFTTFLLPLIAFFSLPVYSAETGAGSVKDSSPKTIILVPVSPIATEEMRPDAQKTQEEMDEPRAPRKTPEPRDPTRGMYDPETDREGDARAIRQLSRDRLNLEGKRSRSLEELASPLRERRSIDQIRGRLREPEERTYGTSSLKDRLSVSDSRRDYRIESSRDLRQEYIDENGSADYRVYRTR